MTKFIMGKPTTATIGDLRGLLTLSRAEDGTKSPLRPALLENSDTHALQSGSGGPNQGPGKGQGPNPATGSVRIVFWSRYSVSLYPNGFKGLKQSIWTDILIHPGAL